MLSLAVGVGSLNQDRIRDDVENQIPNSDCRDRRVDYAEEVGGIVLEIVALTLWEFVVSWWKKGDEVERAWQLCLYKHLNNAKNADSDECQECQASAYRVVEGS